MRTLKAVACAAVLAVAVLASQGQVRIERGWTFTNLLNVIQGTIAADAQAISTTAEWNNAGTTFTHWKANVTDTASASGSLLLDMQVGGASKFTVRKDGLVTSTLGFQMSGGSRLIGQSDGVWTLFNAASTDFNRLQFGGTTSSFPALKRRSASLDVRLADDSAYTSLSAQFDVPSTSFISRGGAVLIAGAAPTISSGFGTSPSIASNNGTASFTVNVGTGGSATSGVIGLPTATTGWNCFVSDQTTNVSTRQTASTTTSATITAASAWTASDTLLVSCFAR